MPVKSIFWRSVLFLLFVFVASVGSCHVCSTSARAVPSEKTVILTLDQWKKLAINKAERIRKNKELQAQVQLLRSLLEIERKTAIDRVLAERVRCADIQKAARCDCPSNTGLFVCLGVCGVVVVGGTLGGVALGGHLKGK